jgi:hypothetical protein
VNIIPCQRLDDEGCGVGVSSAGTGVAAMNVSLTPELEQSLAVKG